MISSAGIRPSFTRVCFQSLGQISRDRCQRPSTGRVRHRRDAQPVMHAAERDREFIACLAASARGCL
jgi:hypothetical protein